MYNDYDRGVRDGQNKVLDAITKEAKKIRIHEQLCSSYGGPDPRGPDFSRQQLDFASQLEQIVSVFRG